MAEIRYNNQGGTLGATLGSSGTIITFGAAPDFATLSGGDYIKLILDYGTANFEIVYLTAYTASATTGTITRSAEDSTNWPAVAHNSTSGPGGGAAVWSCNPTKQNFILEGDGEPGSVIPAFVGQLYIDTTNGGLYQAVSTSTGDFVQVGGGTVLYDFPGVGATGPVEGGSVSLQAGENDSIVLGLGSYAQYLGGNLVTQVSSTSIAENLPKNTSGVAAIASQSITSGSAFRPNTSADTELCFNITTAGSLSMTMGPSTGSENTLFSSVSVATGTVITKRIPAGWRVVVTLATATIGTATIQVI